MSSKNVTVKVAGQVAILEGRVETEHEKSIIERLAKMEPGKHPDGQGLFLKVDPKWNNLHNEPRFTALLEAMHFQ